MKVVARRVLPGYVARNVEANVYRDYLSDSLVFELRSYVLAEDLGTREYEVMFGQPSSWWQHFKRDVLHRRCKVKLETKTVVGHGYRGYPHAPIALPADKLGDAVVFETFEMKPRDAECGS
jgi:hypothetical protein